MLEPQGRIGRYEIERRLAHGGMATLYLARDPVLGRPVALKLFLDDVELADSTDRFEREARVVAALNHPNIVTIYDYGEYGSQPYIVMEFIEGETLAVAIRRQSPIPTTTKLRWMEELCSAVAYAHAHGVIHRDLKPLNLIVNAYGRLKVLDFGIARMRGALASRATARVGTAGYMAPEQIRGGNVDHRSDLFSIGVVCYELMAYAEPFGAESDPAINHRILEDEPQPLDKIAGGIDPEIARIVWTALRKDPAERFADAESLRDAIAEVRHRLELLESASAAIHYVTIPSTGEIAPPRPTRPTPPPAPLATPAGRPTPRHTPGPGDRAEREALVRKRTAQVRESLELGRRFFEEGDLERAQAQCGLVLALDAAHPDALALLSTIQEQAQVRAVPAPARPPLASRKERAGAIAPSSSTASSTSSPRMRPRRTTLIVAIGTAAIVIAVLIVALWPRTTPGAAQASISVLVDAVPWATIKELRNETGSLVPLPEAASTPLALPLAPGTYSIVLEGPPPASDRYEGTIRVAAGMSPVLVVHSFPALTPNEYFERAAGVKPAGDPRDGR